MGRERFLTPLMLKYLDGHEWELIDVFRYSSDVLTRVISVPAGFRTDFNSIPRFFWRILPPAEFAEAGVLHDWGYRTGRLTRKEADAVFREALQHLGAPQWKAWAMHKAVRVFGSGAYTGWVQPV